MAYGKWRGELAVDTRATQIGLRFRAVGLIVFVIALISQI